jgi:hypothetical protein
MSTRQAPLKAHQQPIITETIDPHVPRIDSNGFKRMHLGIKTYSLHLSFGVIRIRIVREAFIENAYPPTCCEKIRRPKHWKMVATFLPKFAYWKILELTFNQRYNSISAGLQTFHLRPGWSPIFEYVNHGDLQGVLNLIHNGFASPNDVDQEGWTVLHVGFVYSPNMMYQPILIYFSLQLLLINSPYANCFLHSALYQTP